jgi:hypothetical protein
VEWRYVQIINLADKTCLVVVMFFAFGVLEGYIFETIGTVKPETLLLND